MEMFNFPITLIALTMSVVGLVMLIFPGSITAIENWLNRNWGEKELFSLRLGTQRERMLESKLNQSVLNRSIHWDGFVRARPRIAGAVICLLALLIMWF